MKRKILVVDDEESIRWVLGNSLQKEGYIVEYGVNGEQAIEKTTTEYYSLIMLDIKMPDIDGLEVLSELRIRGIDIPVIIVTAQNTVRNAIDAMKRGAYDYIAKPFDLDEVIITVGRAIDSYENAKKLQSLKETFKDAAEHHGMVGKSPSMIKIYKTIGRIAEKDLTILIQGESGTGKELIASAIHFNSLRHKEKMVSVNIAALPKDLLESELFGYEKGAFTGAAINKHGRFEEASGGTLHLDEIGDMPLELQTKLLRVLEEKKFYRLGSEKPVLADVRIIVSTNKNLVHEVSIGKFREDLYYRLNAITIDVPPLRERKEDIPVLLDYFLEKYSIEFGLGKRNFTEGAKQLLLDYSWPGNVRELENTTKRVILLTSDSRINPENLLDAAPYLKSPKSEGDGPLFELYTDRLKRIIDDNSDKDSGRIYDQVIRKIEKPLIEEILRLAKGNKKKAAAILGINRNTLSKKMEEYGINSKDFPDN